MRIAIVDIGTNSTRLLIGEGGSCHAGINFLTTGLITTRLGEGIGAGSILTKQAMDRTVDALVTFRDKIKSYEVQKIVVAATSAVRDALNRDEFIEKVRLKLRWNIRVLSGEEEAAFSYLGVVRGLHNTRLSNPVVVDIGGGSTEFIRDSGDALKCVSLRLGAVRMTEQKSTVKDISEVLTEVLADLKTEGVSDLVGVGGTLTTLAAIDQEMVEYDPSRIHGYFVTTEKVEKILARLEGMTIEERKLIPGLQPQRADIIVAGIRIVSAILKGLNATGVTVSESDIMNGLFYNVLENL